MKRTSVFSLAAISGKGLLNLFAGAAAAALAAFGLAACDSDKTATPKIYPVTVVSESPLMGEWPLYHVSAPSEATEGDQVAVTVEIVDEGTIIITDVLVNDERATLNRTKSTELARIYEFEMPSAPADITVLHASSVTVANSLNYHSEFVADNGQGFEPRIDNFFAPGETVFVRIISDAPELKPTGVVLDDGTTADEVEGVDFIWTFEMPEIPVTLDVFIDVNFLTLTEEFDDHCEVIILDNYYNDNPDDYSAHWHMCIPGNPVHYYTTAEIGFDIDLQILGNESGHNYLEDRDFTFEDDYTGAGALVKSVAFFMPAEPVTLKAVSTERNLYPNEAFIGTYANSFWINETLDNHVLSTSSPMMNAELRANGVFKVKSTDGNKYDFAGTFNYDSQSKSFTYNSEDCKTYALQGQVLTNDFVLGIVRNIIEDKPDNTNIYLLSKKAITFVRATGDQRDSRFFIEAGSGSDKTWYLYNKQNYSLYTAEVTFSRGSSLGGVSTALITFGASPWAAKYTLDNVGAAPKIEYASGERGTYTGSGSELWLDGFGSGKYGNSEGTYTISGVQVVFSPASGEDITFNIDQLGKTYQIIEDTSGWNGPLHFSTGYEGGKASGSNAYGDSSTYVEVWLDHNFKGEEQEGMAKLVMRVGTNSLADNGVPYTYNPETNKLILNYWSVYYGASDWVETDNLVFNVSADKQKLTFEQGFVSIFGVRGYAWINGGDETVLAAEK